MAKPHDNGFLRLSQDAGLLLSRIRFLGWCEERPTRVRRLSRAVDLLQKAQEELFLLAADDPGASGELPLFDRPSPVRASFEPCEDPYGAGAGGESFDAKPSPGMRAPAPPADRAAQSPARLPQLELPVGTKVFACNKCNKYRFRSVPICASCGCPEYSLAIVLEDGNLGCDEEARAELMAPPKKRAKKERPVEDRSFIRGPNPAGATGDAGDAAEGGATGDHCYDVYLPDEGQGKPRGFLGNIHAPSLAEATRRAPEVYRGSAVQPGTTLELVPGKGFVDGMFTEIAECIACGKRWPKRESVGCPGCVHAPAEAMPEKDESDTQDREFARSMSEHPKDWRQRSTYCLDLPAATCKKLIHFGYETIGHLARTLDDGKAAQVGSALGDGPGSSVFADKVTIAVQSYVEEEDEPDEGPPLKFLVKAKKGNPLYVVSATSLEKARAYVATQHPKGWDGTVETILNPEWVRLPRWLTTHDAAKREFVPIEAVVLEEAPKAPKTPRKSPERTFEVFYRDDGDALIPLGQIRAKNLDEATEGACRAYVGEEVRAAEEGTQLISEEDLVVKGPVAPARKRKEAAVASD